MKDYDVCRREGWNELDPFLKELFGAETLNETKAHGLMKTDIKENDDDYEVTIDLPSIKKEDVKVSFENGYLNVNVSHNANNDEKDKKGNYIRRERYFGSYSRSYYIGEDVSKENISAKLENGTLNLIIKKAVKQTEETKYIAIQ